MGLLKAGDHPCAHKACWLHHHLAGHPVCGLALRRRSSRKPMCSNGAMPFGQHQTAVCRAQQPADRVCDIAALAKSLMQHGALLAVDNCFAPRLAKPVEMGRTHRAFRNQKYLEWRGRVLAIAVCGPDAIINGRSMTTHRGAGATLAPFSALGGAQGLETLSIRMAAQSAPTRSNWRNGWKRNRASTRFTTRAASHPQHVLADEAAKTAVAARWCLSPSNHI